MLGKPVEEEPDAALLNQKFDDGRGGRGHEAEEEEDDEQVGFECLDGMWQVSEAVCAPQPDRS